MLDVFFERSLLFITQLILVVANSVPFVIVYI
jgi:hypothetical protein